MYVRYSARGSWHIWSGLTSRGGLWHTLCGRWAAKDAPTSQTLPAEKSCESCYRARGIRDES